MLRVIRSWCCPQPTYQCLLELSVHQSAPPSVLSTAANETRHAIAAEVARVQGLSENERQAIGRKYTESEELWSALEAGGSDATLILRSSWLKGQRGGRLPKRGDKLPPEATISVAELRAIAKASNCEYGALPVIALSHFWRTKEHPDPDGETLELIVASLEERWEEFEKRKVSDVGIIIDWCALYQAPRTPQQEVSFKAGLKAINQWYAHQGTTVWLVTAGADRVKGLTYWQKGWTSFEYALAMLIKPANTSNMKDWAQVVDLGQEPGKRQTEFGRPALTEPLAFFQGHRYGDKTYTNGADRDAIVAPKFRETMFEVLGGVRELNLGTLKWGDAGAEALAVVLPLCGQLKTLQLHQNFIGAAGAMALARAMGSMAKLKELYLHNNNIGDQGLSSLSEALAKGSLAQLTELWLHGNEIGDVGMSAFANACAKGSFANLTVLHLLQNEITDDGFAALFPLIKKDGKLSGLKEFSIGSGITDKSMTEFADLLAKGSLAQLTRLELHFNKIGDPGLTSLADACAKGSLAQLTHLDLFGNQFGDPGLASLADACAKGSLASLKEIVVDNKHERHPQLLAACRPRGIQIA